MLYFDHSATTPIRQEVLILLEEAQRLHFGNPSSTYKYGQKSRVLLEKARRQVADSICAKPNEIVFTGGGSESNNIVLWNLLYSKNKHVITSEIEHPAILNVLHQLRDFGITYTALPVDQKGLVSLEAIKSAIQDDTGLITIMMANNEVGTIEPIEAISKIAHENSILMHTDAVQAMGKIKIDVKSLDVDMLSLSAHKFYGPKGLGILYVKKGIKLNPLIGGGGQEHGLRSGTENIPSIAATGLATQLASDQCIENAHHLTELENQFKSALTSRYSRAIFNGHPETHLPGLVSVAIPDVPSDFMIINLDLQGIAISSGSACSSGTVKPSRILTSLGISNELNVRTLRISFGKDNSADDVSTLVDAMIGVIQKASKYRV